MNNKGQGVLSEHVMIFFVVIAAVMAMGTFVERGFEARIRDARNFMVSSVNSVCDAGCQMAAGGGINKEYEPYYELMVTGVEQNSVENHGATSGLAAEIGATYYKLDNEATNSSSVSYQLPPCTANGGTC